MKHLSTRYVLFTFLAAGLFILSSCISDSGFEQTSSIQLGLGIDNMDTSLKAGGDSIRIDEVRIIFDDLYFKTDQDSVPFLSQPGQAGLNANNSNYQNPRGLIGRAAPAGIYNSFTMNIVKVPENGENNIDSDFVDSDGTRYSIIVEGAYNDSDFTYKSQQTINETFSSFGPVEVAEHNDSYTFLMTSDVRIWFTGPDGYLDPNDEANYDQIESNISGSFGFEEYDPATTQ